MRKLLAGFLVSILRLSTLGLLMPLAGCLIPTYQHPQGFSSTYYHHLQQVTAASMIAPPTVPASPVAETQPKLVLPAPMEAVSPPVEIPPEPAPADAEKRSASNSGAWWSWIRRPLTFRLGRTTEADLPTEPPEPSDGSDD